MTKKSVELKESKELEKLVECYKKKNRKRRCN